MYDNSDDTFYSTGKVSFDINANEVFILIWFCVYHSKKANWTGVIFIIIISRKISIDGKQILNISLLTNAEKN